MDFTFDDEQDMLRASVRAVMADRYPIERVAAIADGGGFDRGEWTIAVDAGWTDISVPESEGGAGLGFVEEMIVAEELGRALYPGPFLASVVMALPLLRAAGSTDPSVARGERVASVGFGGPLRESGGRITGTVLFVPNLDIAELIVVVGDAGDGPAAWTLDRDGEGVRWSVMPTVDGTRAQGELVMEGAPATALGVGADQIERVRHRALVALAAEACGLASVALERSVAFARERRQFGRPIGSFQGVAHELARAYMDVEISRSLTYWAGWAVQEGDPAAPAAAAAAKARSAEAAVLTCERAIQAHGGIGFTWEHPLHRYYKRALAIASTLETADELWARVADSVVLADPVVAVASPA
jgi:alkylation response protein AidB-like acyl-CoA dehydrogenase